MGARERRRLCQDGGLLRKVKKRELNERKVRTLSVEELRGELRSHSREPTLV